MSEAIHFELTEQQSQTIDYFIESEKFVSQNEVIREGFQLLCENYMPQLAGSGQSKIIERLIASGQFADQSAVVRACFRLLCENRISRLIEEGRNGPIIENWTADSFLVRMEKRDDGRLSGKGAPVSPKFM